MAFRVQIPSQRNLFLLWKHIKCIKKSISMEPPNPKPLNFFLAIKLSQLKSLLLLSKMHELHTSNDFRWILDEHMSNTRSSNKGLATQHSESRKQNDPEYNSHKENGPFEEGQLIFDNTSVYWSKVCCVAVVQRPDMSILVLLNYNVPFRNYSRV